jgi:hypothetical protein
VKIRPTWPLTGAEAALPSQVAEMASAIRGENNQLAAEDSQASTIAMLYAIRTTRNLDAIAHLCSHGFAAEAIGIVRAIAEDAVSLAYLADEPEERARAWIDFAESRIASHLRSGGVPDGGNWWSGMGPTRMAPALRGRHRQIGDEFIRMYWRLCDDTHGSPVAAGHYLVFTEETERAPFVHMGPSNYRIAEVCASACVCAWRLCAVAAELGVQLDEGAIARRAKVVTDAYAGNSAE